MSAAVKFTPAAAEADHEAAVDCLEEIAFVASRLDRELFFDLGRLGEKAADPDIERAILLLDRLRDGINLIGFIADLGSNGDAKGDAVEWLMSPRFCERRRARVEGKRS